MTNRVNNTRPLLKTRKFSTHHIDIFNEVLISRKTNRALNIQFGYSPNSHLVVDHSRKAMHKILALENSPITAYKKQVTYPRNYLMWWLAKLEKHRSALMDLAVKAEFY